MLDRFFLVCLCLCSCAQVLEGTVALTTRGHRIGFGSLVLGSLSSSDSMIPSRGTTKTCVCLWLALVALRSPGTGPAPAGRHVPHPSRQSSFLLRPAKLGRTRTYADLCGEPSDIWIASGTRSTTYVRDAMSTRGPSFDKEDADVGTRIVGAPACGRAMARCAYGLPDAHAPW